MIKKILLFLLVTCHLSSTEELSIEEKVGQLLLVHFNGSEANEDAIALITKAHVGGFIYYEWANKLTSPSQVSNLSKSLQALSKKTLLIAVDQEGGLVTRLKNGFTHPPGQPKVGQMMDPKEAGYWANIVGKELHDVGVNLNLAPVVDIATDPETSPLRRRSWGSDPYLVTLFAKEAAENYLKHGVAPALKHFPGLGDTATDTHLEMAINRKSLPSLMKWELVPYIKLSKQIPAIVTAHVMIPSIDPEYPATFSRKIIDGVLRKTIRFNGLVISDSLAMEGLLKTYPNIAEAAIHSIQSGHDMVILGGKQLIGENIGFELNVDDILKIHQAIVEAVKNGRIELTQLDQSVKRILKLKNRLQ